VNGKTINWPKGDGSSPTESTMRGSSRTTNPVAKGNGFLRIKM